MNWIFFDLDDTLWNFTDSSSDSLKNLYTAFPEINGTFESAEDFMKEYHIHNSKLWDMHHAGKIPSSFLRPERWRLTLETKNTSLNETLCRKMDSTYLNTLCRSPKCIAGAKELLALLSQHYLIGVISNGFTDTQYVKTQVSGLDKFISRMIISEEIGIQKPDVRIFDYAISETGADSSPFFIGDNPKTDIAGALNAGWRAIWFNPKENQTPAYLEEIICIDKENRKMVGNVRSLSEITGLLN